MTFFKNEILNKNLKTLSEIATNEFNNPFDITCRLSFLLKEQIKKGLIEADDPELKAHYNILINKHGDVFMEFNFVRCNDNDIVFFLNAIDFMTYKAFFAIPWHTDCPKKKEFFENNPTRRGFTIKLKDLDNYHVVPHQLYPQNIWIKNWKKNNLTNKK